MNDFDAQPRLADAVVRLRPMIPDEFDALFAVASDREIWAIHPAHDRWQEPVFRRFFADGLASGGALVIEDAATGAVIGSSRFDPTRAGVGEIEIGWTFLARSHWGGAANRSVKRLMIGHALTTYRRVIFLVGEGNARSRRAMDKIGAVLTDRRHDVALADGVARHVIYAIDRAGFEGGPLNG
ncbi:GNAT family N-acetyltransferase [Sphingomonas floccifaciens]|uniref:GNAT family N-acetyltransferase n=1 Tax=Sphingomonas floccifaciens TaxID=1844115 RepID=A0ABW4NBN4_9SPHN